MNMRRIPFALKLGLSSLISGAMCYSLYTDNLYDESLYSMAVKYRSEYDDTFVQNQHKEKLNTVFG